MTKSDAKKFSEILVGLREVLGGDLSQQAIHLYFAVLESLTIEQVESAAKEILKSWRYRSVPPPAVFLAAANGNDDQAITNAWNHVVNQAGRLGADRKPTFDPIVLEAIESAGGWRRICLTDTDKIDSIRDAFAASFRNSRWKPENERIAHVPGQILNLIEAKK